MLLMVLEALGGVSIEHQVIAENLILSLDMTAFYSS